MAQHFQSARTRPWKVVATEATEAASRLCLNPRQESSEATPANKMASISDLLHAIKTDPEVKQLLASALANDKPYALNLNSNCASELLPDPALGFSNVDSVNDAASSAMDTPQTSNNNDVGCGWARSGDCGWCADTVDTQGGWGSRQSVNDGPEREDRSSWSRFSGAPPHYVVAGGVSYYLHDSIYDRLFPGGQKNGQLVGMSADNFDAVLEFLYSGKTQDLGALFPDHPRQVENFAIDCGSMELLSAVLEVREADVLSVGLLPQVARIYASWNDHPQFRDYFRKTLREELLRRFEAGENTDLLVSRVTTSLQKDSASVEDITKVLHNMWINSASGKGFHKKSSPCSCGSDIDCTCYHPNIAAAGGWGFDEYRGPTVTSAQTNNVGWETADHTAANIGTASRDPTVPVATGFGLPFDTVDGLYRGSTPTSTIFRGTPNIPFSDSADHPGGPSRSDYDFEEPSPTSEEPENAASPLEKTSALARCVYQWFSDTSAATATAVAESLGCTEGEALAALNELADIGMFNCDAVNDGTVRYWQCAWPNTSDEPLALPDRSNNNFLRYSPYTDKKPASKVVSGLARGVHYWLKQQLNGWEGSPRWITPMDVATNLGCTIEETRHALEELSCAGLVDVQSSPTGFHFNLYRARPE